MPHPVAEAPLLAAKVRRAGVWGGDCSEQGMDPRPAALSQQGEAGLVHLSRHGVASAVRSPPRLLS